MAVERDNPYGNFNFQVSWPGEDGSAVTSGFSEVTGLDMEIEVIEYRNGNERENRARKVPGLRKTANVTLKRGVIGAIDLWTWAKTTADGTVVPREVTIALLDEAHNPVLMWKLANAWPCKWSGPALAAKGGDVAIEELVLAHEGISMQ